MTCGTCSECRWWTRIPKHVRGECRVHAPVVLLMKTETTPNTVTAWPATRQDEFCGEFASRETEAHG